MSAVYYRDLLKSAQAQSFYDRILCEIENGNLSGLFELEANHTKTAINDAFSAVNALKRDRPDIFFLGRECKAEQTGKRLKLTCEVLYTDAQIKRINRLLNNLLNRLTADTDDLDELEREKLIYKRVALHGKYEDSGTDEDHSVVGMVLNKKGVCEGYSALLTLALRRARIRCIIVRGIGHGENHCWNVAWCNGAACHLDVTWETVFKDDIGYFWFNLSDDEISRDHIINFDEAPGCPIAYASMQGIEVYDVPKEGMHYIIGEFAAGKRTARVAINNTDDVELWIKRAIFFSPTGKYRYILDSSKHKAFVVKEK